MDSDGYPTDEELKTISSWDIATTKDAVDLLKYVRTLWKYDDYITVEDGVDTLEYPCKKWHISTAGWSGNESIIGALQENTMFWIFHWEQSRRGGHYIFEVRKE